MPWEPRWSSTFESKNALLQVTHHDIQPLPEARKAVTFA